MNVMKTVYSELERQAKAPASEGGRYKGKKAA